jgi:hypothetical protein
MEDELPNEGLTVTFVKIEDVTTQILEGTATLPNGLTNRKNSRKHHPIERLFRKNLGKKIKFVRL